MKNISISLFINTIFIIAFIAICSTFVIFIKFDKERYEISQKLRYELIADAFLSGFQFFPNDRQLSKLYGHFNVAPIQDEAKKIHIITNSSTDLIKQTPFGRVRLFSLNNEHYIYVQEIGYNILLKDTKPKPYSSKIALIIFACVLFVLAFLYTALTKKLHPLRDLNFQIEKFSKGDLSVKTAIDGNDEIAKISKNFNNAIEYINKLIKSKNLFMRNMMHELKTPITKGMFLSEAIQDEKEKEMLGGIFERMNEIINELAKIEKLSASTAILDKKELFFSEIYNEAVKLLMTTKNEIKAEMEDFKLIADKALFAIVIKNLLDNAIKFSPDSSASIKADKNAIEIVSGGDALALGLEAYTEPFFQKEKKERGFGLGLYIVKTILELHGLELEYKREENKNIFFINLRKK